MKKPLAVSIMKVAPLCFIALFTFTFSLFTHLCSAQYTDLINFTGTSGSYIGEDPEGSLTLSGDTLYGMTKYGGIDGVGNIFSVQTDGTNYKDLVDFTGTSGSYIGDLAFGSLTLSGDTLYGMTAGGGIGYGNIFSVQTDGTNFKDLVDFTATSGSYVGWVPLGSLTLSGDTLYGMTELGGINELGNIFSVQTNGTNFKDLVDFTGTSGSYIGEDPEGSLTLSGDTLYGMTLYGGIDGDGNIFSVQTNGTNYKNLVDFTGGSAPYIGANPEGSLTLSGDTLYGMTFGGGINDSGNIFSIQTNGTNFKDLVDFTGTSGSYIGAYPLGSLILSGDTLYGMTSEYSTPGIGDGNIFSVQTNGTNYTDLIDFTGTSGSYIGEYPFGSLTLLDDTLYGMTYQGGVNGYGNIFSFKPTAVTTSVNPLSAGTMQLKVYPNPNKGIFTLTYYSDPPAGGEESLPIIEIYNVLGQNVLTETLRSAQGDNLINLTNQPSGVYLYRVLTGTGSLVGEGKLVIEK